MKLLHAICCGDVVRLYSDWRACHCGRSRGRYVSDTHVALVGDCRAIGIDTGEWRAATGNWHVSKNVKRTRAR